MEANSAEEEASIGPLLARANLLRMRRQWDEAAAACTEALERVPRSATACSLLGDIYEAQGKRDEAMHWFGMAVEFDPGNKSDRAKLDRIVAQQRRTSQAGDRAAGPPPSRQEKLARAILFAGLGLFSLLTFAATFVYFGGVAPERGARPAPAVPRSTVVVPPAPPSPAPGRTLPPPLPVAPLRPTDPSPAAPATPPPAEDALRAAAARAAPADALVTGAQVDPRSSGATLAIAVPRAETTDRTRERILRAAAGCLRAVAREFPQTRSATIRVSLRGAAALAFVGDADIAALRTVEPAAATEAQLLGLFTHPWWAPDLAAGVSAPRPAFPSAPDNSPPDRVPALR